MFRRRAESELDSTSMLGSGAGPCTAVRGRSDADFATPCWRCGRRESRREQSTATQVLSARVRPRCHHRPARYRVGLECVVHPPKQEEAASHHPRATGTSDILRQQPSLALRHRAPMPQQLPAPQLSMPRRGDSAC